MKCTVLLRIVAVVFVALGSILIFSMDNIFNCILKKEMTLSPSSKIYEFWRKTPVPIIMDAYFFNCTNPEQLKHKDYKPHFVEMGPYRFKEFHEKVDITWNTNDTVTYKKKIVWHFDAENSNGSMGDNVTVLNMVAASCSYIVRYWSSFASYPVSVAIGIMEKTIWTMQKAGEILFDGYVDPLLSVASTIPGLSSMEIPQDKAGFFYKKNGSTFLDGVLNVDAGTRNILNLGSVYQWNYRNQTELSEGRCNEVSGTSGEFFPQGYTRELPLRMFVPQLCRTITLDYLEDTEVSGIPGYRYVFSKSMWDNGTTYPESRCNCDGDCLPYGIMNISACRYGGPVFISQPHFLDADPHYRNEVTGMKPDPIRHRFELVLEPTTGIPLKAAGRMQFNLLMITNPKIRMFQDTPTILFPIMWFEETAAIPPEFASSLKILLSVPIAGFYCAIGLMVLGLIIFLTTIPHGFCKIKYCKNNRNRKPSEQNSLRITFSNTPILPVKPMEDKHSHNSPEKTAFLDPQIKRNLDETRNGQ